MDKLTGQQKRSLGIDTSTGGAFRIGNAEMDRLLQRAAALGYDEGHDKGYEDGCDDGYSYGYSVGRTEGYDEGYDDSEDSYR